MIFFEPPFQISGYENANIEFNPNPNVINSSIQQQFNVWITNYKQTKILKCMWILNVCLNWIGILHTNCLATTPAVNYLLDVPIHV